MMGSADDTESKTQTREQARRAAQLAFLASGEEIEVGDAADCPLPVDALANVRGDEPWVKAALAGGLTARVYRVHAEAREWTLKRARERMLVQNADGQTSFLNEVQRRRDFALLHADQPVRKRFCGIVQTRYASLRRGIILSPWIEGAPVAEWDRARLVALFDQLVELLLAGLFEWDLCPGNIVGEGAHLTLFDFGYMYRFDPLTEFNSNGRDTPLFHGAERFETRNYFAFLLGIERSRGLDAALGAFREEKAIALAAYRRLARELAVRGAAREVTDWLRASILRWEDGLAGDLSALYLAEGWRSHLLDLEDDLHGKTATPVTLQRADWLLSAVDAHFPQLESQGALFGDYVGLSRQAIIDRIAAKRAQAADYQVDASHC